MTKGYVKKMKTKRVLALLMAAIMVITLMVPQTVHAEDTTTEQYVGGTELENLLTYYQYVVMQNASLKNHTVGSVAVGGTLSSNNTIGDGAQIASYANKISSATIGNATGYGAATREFYYADPASKVNSDFTENPDYFGSAETIDVDSNTVNKGVYDLFINYIQPASAELAAQTPTHSYTYTEDHAMGFPVIDITLEPVNTVITIPYEDFQKAKAINISIDDINYFSQYSYTINIVGVGSNTITVDGEAYQGSANSASTDVFVNGKQYAYLGDMDGTMCGIEINLSGMKLIWNFPDATGTIMWNAVGGHLVAPDAGVRVTSGRFEGGIIAKGLVSTGEAHYYPYNGFTLNTLQNINVIKKYIDENGAAVEVTEHAQFGLFTDADCTVAVKDADGADVVATVSATNGIASFPSESLGLDKTATYYVKEISAPDGFEINDTVYLCEFTAGGLVTYSELGKDGVPVYSSTSPVVENLQTTYTTEEVGALIVTVLDKDTNEVIEGVVITVTDADGETVIVTDGSGNPIDKTNENGVITYKDIAQGQYTVTMTIPEGYVSNDEYSVEVDVSHTTYHTFELEQVKEPIVVYLREEGTNNKISDGAMVVLQARNENGSWHNVSTAWIGSTGQVTFNNNVAGEYKVILQNDPKGWNLAATHDGVAQTSTGNIVIAVSDNTDVNEHTFYFDKKLGSVEVTVYEYDENSTPATTSNVIGENGTSVTLTQADGTKTTLTDSDKDGVVTFENIPVGDVKVELTTSPDGYLKPADTTLTSTTVTVEEGTTAQASLYAEEIETTKTGDLVITTETLKSEMPDATGVEITITKPSGDELVITMNVKDTETIEDLTPGDYIVEITTTPDNWKTTSTVKQVVTVPEEGQGEAEYVFTQTGDMEIIVVEKESGNNVGQAIATVKDANGDAVLTITTTGANSVPVKDLPVGDYTVTVTVPEGYVESGDKISATNTTTNTTTITVTAGGNTEAKAELTLTRYGCLTVTVVDKDEPSTVVPGVVVTVYDSENNLVGGGTTNNAGKVVVEDLPAGDYTACYTKFASGSSSAKVYEVSTDKADTTQIATITATEDGEATLAVVKLTGTLIIQVINQEGYIDGAKVDVEGTEKEITDGEITISKLDADEYDLRLTVIPEDHILDPSNTSERVATVTAGDSTTVIYKLLQVAEVKITVKEEGTGDPIPDAKVEVEIGTDTNGDPVIITGTTDNNGEVTLEIPVKDNTTIKVTEVPDGYEEPEDQVIDVGPGQNEVDFVVEPVVPPTGTLKVCIVDADGNVIEEDAVVTVNGTEEALTDGIADLGEVPADDYIVKITELPDGYELVFTDGGRKEVTVDDGEDEVVNIVLKQIKYDLTVVVKDKDTNEVVADTTVEILDENGNTVIETTTNNNGEITVEVPKGNYTIVVKDVPDGYDNPSDDSSYVPTEVEVTEDTREFIEFIGQTVVPPVTTGTLIIQVIDQNGKKVDGAVVVVDSVNTTITGGEYKKTEVEAGDYELVLNASGIPANYILNPTCDAEQPAVIVAGKTTTVVYELIQTATIDITVKEEGTEEPIPGAKVEIEIDTDNDGTPEGTITGTTDADGKVTLDVPVKDDTTIKVTDVPDGYDKPEDQIVDVVPGNNEADFVVEPIGKVTVTVYDKTANDAVVPGAGVSLLMHATGSGTEKYVSDANGDRIILTTNANGQVTFDKLADGTYSAIIESVPANYILANVEAGADQATVTNGSHATALHKLYAVGNMSITVVNKTTGEVVPNAEVTVEGPTVDGTNVQNVNTGATGTIVLQDQIIGDYELTAKDVEDCEFYGANNGSLTVEKGETAEQKFEVVQTAGMTITVVDKVTGDPIPGADITVTDPYGDSKDYTTDDNGQVNIDKQPVGENTVEINRVPSTNVLPDDTDEKITTSVGGDNEVKIEAPKPSTEKGNLTITVVDQVTGAIVPGATVEIKDPSGNVMGTEITNDKGQIEKTDIATGKYTVTVTDVPSGYTKPSGDPTYVTVLVGNNTVKVEIKKPTASDSGTAKPAPAPTPAPATPSTNSNVTIEKAPQTGDISYMPFAVAMMVISVLGLAGIAVYRKKTESER